MKKIVNEDGVVIELKILFELPFYKGYSGTAFLPGIAFVKNIENDIVVRHEQVHLRQQKEYGVFKYYAIYIFDFIKNLIKFKNTKLAYYLIDMEREAYLEVQGKEYYEKKINKYLGEKNGK